MYLFIFSFMMSEASVKEIDDLWNNTVTRVTAISTDTIYFAFCLIFMPSTHTRKAGRGALPSLFIAKL